MLMLTHFMTAWLHVRVSNRTGPGDRGEGVVQFLIITAAVAVGALAVVAVWSGLVNDKANSITLD